MRLVADDVWAVLTIWMEARGEPQEGRIAVAEVLRDRTRLRYQSDGTVPGTCLRALQFSCWNATDPNRILAAKLDDRDPLVPECFAAWREAIAGSNYAKQGLLYYNPAAVRIVPPWVGACHQVAAIGRHLFFRPGPL